MEGASSSSSSSASSSSHDDVAVKATDTIKFLCSYGGKILPRYPDGKLRYFGGHTRVLSVDRSMPFSELQVKLREVCGWAALRVRCQLPAEDMDALVFVNSDEDVANLVKEYDMASRDRIPPLKIRAFFLPSASSKTPHTPISPSAEVKGKRSLEERCVHQAASMPGKILGRQWKTTAAGELRFHDRHHHQGAHGTPRPCNYLVRHGNHWKY